MSQRNWSIVAVVVVVLAVGYMFWPGGASDTAVVPTGDAETTAPAE
jgi:hypothetical protein